MKYKIYYNAKGNTYINRYKHRCYLNDYIFNQELQIIYLEDGAYNVNIEYGINDYIILTKIETLKNDYEIIQVKGV